MSILQEKLQHRYALSEKGAQDMMKAFVSVTISDLVLMFPVWMLYFLVRDYLQSGAEVSAGYGSFCTFRLPVHLQCHRRSLPRNELPAGKKCRDQRR